MTNCRKVLFSLFGLSLFTSMAGMEIFSWSLFLLALVELSRTRDLKSLLIGIDVVLWGFVVIVGLSLALNVESFDGFMEYFGSLRWVFLLYAYVYLMKRDGTVIPERGLQWTLTAGVILACGYGLLQFLTGLNPLSSRIVDPAGNFFRATGFFSMPLTYGYCMGIGGLLLLGLSHNETARNKSILYAAVAASALGVLISLTRGAWVAAFISFFGLVLMQFGLRKVWKYILGFLLMVVLIVSFNESLRNRAVSIVDTQNHSNSLRFSIWKANFQMFKEQPLLGVGLGQNKRLLPEYYTKVGIAEEFIGHAHSNYVQFLSGTGILGLLCYLFISFYFLRLAYVLWETQGPYSGLGLGTFWAQIYMHIGGLTECNFTDGEVTHIVVLCWALVVVASVRAKGDLKV